MMQKDHKENLNLLFYDFNSTGVKIEGEEDEEAPAEQFV